MKKVHNLWRILALLVFFLPGLITNAQDLIISGICDGPISGAPKVLELYVVNDIPDLSAYTIKNQTNTSTTWGSAYTLSGSATAGDYIFITGTSGTAVFNSFFENTLTPLENNVINLNGNDRVAIFDASDNIIDIFGEAGVDGTGTAWEYLDGWAYRTGITAPTSTFTLSDWSFSGINNLEGGLTNATCTAPMPIGTFTLGGGGLAYPFYETFETWPLVNWTVEGTSSYVWESNNGTSHGPGSAFEGTLAAMFDVYNASSGNTTTMTTAEIDMSTAVSPILKFQYWMEGSADVNLWIKAEISTDGTNWTQIFYQQQDGIISSWTEVTVPLVGTNSTTQIRLTGSSDWGTYNLFVDDLQIKETPTTTVDWCNLQWPNTAAVQTNTTFDVYARVYEVGVTDAVGQGAGIECWIGYSNTDTDPSTWTNWVAATYFGDADGLGLNDNDEYSYALSFPTSGTYYYASRFRLDGGPFTYGGYNVGGGGFWDGTTNVSGVATITSPMGADCANPFIVSVPADLTYNHSSTTCGLGNVYNLGATSYDNGEDAIYRLDVTSSTVVRITMTPSVTWTGLFLFDGCPD
ncbi:MAG: lamin tail domain-containing protein, partial [Bacteroidales bacterium]|nr:lamin tail domain-containing protein [Bacteroidales bacterium]